MPRKVTKKLQRELKPDRRYQSVLVQRLINKSMLDGKKLAAERAVYTALETAAKKLDSEDPLAVFEKALKNVSPNFEVKSRRVGGANYQIPFPVQGHRQLHYAFSWLVQSARARSGMPYSQRLALEIVDAYNEAGTAFKIEFVLTIRELFHLPLRQATGFLEFLFRLMGITSGSLDYTTVSKRMPSIKVHYRRKIAQSVQNNTGIVMLIDSVDRKSVV